MTERFWIFFAVAFVLALPGLANSDPQTYRMAFREEVIEFANLNRLNISRLHRDVHADCYIPVTIATTILRDGSVRDVALVQSSTVPVVDRYFVYVIEQAAPYQPLDEHYEPAPEQVTLTEEFRLDVRLWGKGVRSNKACEELQPKPSQS
jgi:hypothetical protein